MRTMRPTRHWKTVLTRVFAAFAAAAFFALPLLGGCNKNGNVPGEPAEKVVRVDATGQPGEQAQPNVGTRRVSAPITATDPCAMRLHDVSGPLLLYYGLNLHMPESLEQLRTLPGADPSLSFACPVSGKPYVYAPNGVAVPNQKGFAVLYDPEPSHSNHHWAVMVEEQPDKPLLTRVVAVPAGALPRR